MGKDLQRQLTVIRVVLDLQVRVFRDGLAALLSDWPEIEVLNNGTTNESNPQPQRSADVVLLDTGPSSDFFLQTVQDSINRYPSAKVIVIGVADQPNEIIPCIEAGASAYASVDTCPQELVEIIRSVHQGQVVCPPEISALLFERLASLSRQVGPRLEDKLSTLTPRELEILQLITNGLSNKEIARAIQLELQTVKNYVHSILEKLRVQNRREAARYARSCGGLDSRQLSSADATLTPSV